MACCAFAIFLIAQLLYFARRIRALFGGSPAEADVTVLSGAVAWSPEQVVVRPDRQRAVSHRKWMVAAASGFLLAAPVQASNGTAGAQSGRVVEIGGYQVSVCGPEAAVARLFVR